MANSFKLTRYHSTHAVGERLFYSSQTIRQLIASGRLRAAQRPDGRYVVAESELRRFIRACVRAEGRNP